MTYYNINDPEELLMGKIEYDKIEKKKAEKQKKDWEKTKIEEFVGKLDLTKKIFTYQDDEGNVDVIPYQIYNDNLVYYVGNENEKMFKNFQRYIKQLDKLSFSKMTLEEMVTDSLANQYYIIENKNIYRFNYVD